MLKLRVTVGHLFKTGPSAFLSLQELCNSHWLSGAEYWLCWHLPLSLYSLDWSTAYWKAVAKSQALWGDVFDKVRSSATAPVYHNKVTGLVYTEGDFFFFPSQSPVLLWFHYVSPRNCSHYIFNRCLATDCRLEGRQFLFQDLPFSVSIEKTHQQRRKLSIHSSSNTTQKPDCTAKQSALPSQAVPAERFQQRFPLFSLWGGTAAQVQCGSPASGQTRERKTGFGFPYTVYFVMESGCVFCSSYIQFMS